MLYHMDFCRTQLMTRQLALLEVSQQENTKGHARWRPPFLYNWISRVTPHHPCLMLLIRCHHLVQPHCGKEDYTGCEYRRWATGIGTLKVVYHTGLDLCITCFLIALAHQRNSCNLLPYSCLFYKAATHSEKS